MAKTDQLFRSYILLRAWFVAVAAVLAACVLTIAFTAQLVNDDKCLNRFGLALQIVGLVSLIPHTVGKARLRRVFRLRPIMPPVDEVIPPEGLPSSPQATAAAPAGGPPPRPHRQTRVTGEALFHFYRYHNLELLGGNLAAALAIIYLMTTVILQLPPPQAARGWVNNSLLLGVLGFVAFTWLNLFMLVQVYSLSRTKIPRRLLAFFFAFDFLLGMVGVFVAALMHMVTNWLKRGLRFLFENGLRRVIIAVALPFMIAGIFFQLLASFY